MKIEITTGSYNERRYEKPWIAKVDFSDPKGNFIWGDWVGDARTGSSGILIIEVNPGDVIAEGQKDFRKPKNSSPSYAKVFSDGTLFYFNSKAEAYKYFQEKKSTDEDLFIPEF